MMSTAAVSHIAVGVVAAAAIVLFIVWNSWNNWYKKQSRLDAARVNSLEKGVSSSQLIAALHRQQPAAESSRRRPSLPAFRRGGSGRPLFNWADHPSLVSDAVESGWPRFAFTLSPSVRPTSILGMCAAGDASSSALETEISWEIGPGSVDLMQRIRLNPGLKRTGSNPNSNSSLSVIRTALPLPGPACAFPQEAYFEIIILSCREEDAVESIKIRERERMKLIKEEGSNERLNTLPGGGGEDVRGGGGHLVAVGLTAGGVLPMKVPGSYPGSIGFSSTGSIYHNGNKLVSESEKGEWGLLTGKVIGCSFIPAQKKVSFTIDSELVHAIHCTTDEFGTPLYPTLAANCDITVLVNNGQSPFKYAHANDARRPNPCFLESPRSKRSGIFSEDSKELFSMGRIDSQWKIRPSTRSGVYTGSENARFREFDEESDIGDLFEIILEGNGTSACVGR
uniref:SPRY domain-containing protein n=1 Tax=Kalanchoe fedtschenkoi TaxID=63787 RepID=A0A7N0SXH6_KALFE